MFLAPVRAMLRAPASATERMLGTQFEDDSEEAKKRIASLLGKAKRTVDIVLTSEEEVRLLEAPQVKGVLTKLKTLGKRIRILTLPEMKGRVEQMAQSAELDAESVVQGVQGLRRHYILVDGRNVRVGDVDSEGHPMTTGVTLLGDSTTARDRLADFECRWPDLGESSPE